MADLARTFGGTRGNHTRRHCSRSHQKRDQKNSALADDEDLLRCPYCGESNVSQFLFDLNHHPFPRPYGYGIGVVCVTQELMLNHVRYDLQNHRPPNANDADRLIRQGFDLDGFAEMVSEEIAAKEQSDGE